MSEESFNPLIEPELEARIIAMVLGEASEFECDELVRLIEERPELADFLRQMQRVHGLLSEVGEGEVESPAGNWKLPAEKRNAVQAVIRGDATVQSAPANNLLSTPLRAAGRRRFLRPLLSGAVVLGSLGIGGLALFSFNTNEKAQSVTEAGMLGEADADISKRTMSRRLSGRFLNESLEGMQNTAQTGSVLYSPSKRRSLISASPNEGKSKQALSAIQDTLGTIAANSSDHYLDDDVQFFDDDVKFERPLDAITGVEVGSREDLSRLSSSLEKAPASQVREGTSRGFMAQSGNTWLFKQSEDVAGANIVQSDSQPNIASFFVPNLNQSDSDLDGVMLGAIDSGRMDANFDSLFMDSMGESPPSTTAQPSPDSDLNITGTSGRESLSFDSPQRSRSRIGAEAVKSDAILDVTPRIFVDEEKEELILGRNSIVQSTKEQAWDLSGVDQSKNELGQISEPEPDDFGAQLTSPQPQKALFFGEPLSGQELARKGKLSSVDESVADGEEFRFGISAGEFGDNASTPTGSANGTVTDLFGRSQQNIDGKVATGGFEIDGGAFGGGSSGGFSGGGGFGGRRFDPEEQLGETQAELPSARESLGTPLKRDSGLIASSERSESEQPNVSGSNVLRRQFGLNVDSPAQVSDGLGVEDTRASEAADYLNFQLAMPTAEAAIPALAKDNHAADTSLNLSGKVDVQTQTDAGIEIVSNNASEVGKSLAIVNELEALDEQPIVSYSVEQPVQEGRQLQELSVAGQVAKNLPVLNGRAPIDQVQSKFSDAVDQFDELMKQGRLAEAGLVAQKAKDANPNRPEAVIMVEKAKLQQQIAAIEDIKKRRADSALEQFNKIEESFALPGMDYKNSDSKSWKGLAKRRSARQLKDEALAIPKAKKAQSQSRSPVSKVSAIAGLNEKSAADEAFSTFSLHVSDVSFKLAMAALGKGEWPETSKIRIEEFVNAFNYGDPLPGSDEKVACAIEQSIHPFLQQRNLLRVSMRTAAAGRASATPLRLTFLLDNSGSMERYDRQQTVRRAFAMLAQQLTPIDQVTLISFARQPRLLADQVSGSEAEKLVGLIDELPSEGGTNIEAALQLAYEKATEQQTPGVQNRIILLTDGAVNLGNANPESLSQMVTTMRNKGIAFDAAGISADGLNDEVLEALTRKGDGRYYLLDSLESADDGFAQQIAGALRPSAKNVKVQVEFNPKRVGKYKLLGFEKHALKKEDFRNDKVDAAEMAAAEAGVAMYQFEALPDGEGDVGSVSVRFLDLSTGQMVENRWPIPYHADAPRPAEAAPSLRIASAAALFAAKLKGEALGASVDLKTLSGLLSGLPEQVGNETRIQQLRQMIEQARQLSEQ